MWFSVYLIHDVSCLVSLHLLLWLFLVSLFPCLVWYCCLLFICFSVYWFVVVSCCCVSAYFSIAVSRLFVSLLCLYFSVCFITVVSCFLFLYWFHYCWFLLLCFSVDAHTCFYCSCASLLVLLMLFRVSLSFCFFYYCW